MSTYRKFSVRVRIAIVGRASDGAGRIHCESCGRFCPKRSSYEIDHIIPEHMRPEADKHRPLVAADGWVLCIPCHDEKTGKDVSEIALAKRREAYALGIESPNKRKMRSRPKEPRPAYKPAAGVPRLMREGFVPAGRR